MSEAIRIELKVNDKKVQNISVFPYRLNSTGNISDPEQLALAIRNGESYASLVYLMGGTNKLYKMMRVHFQGTLVSLRKRWGVQIARA